MSLAHHAKSAAIGRRTRNIQRRLGVTLSGKPMWTEKEDSLLRELVPNYGKICKLLPHRTRKGISARCAKLGLRKHNHFWSASEISKLRKLYPGETSENLSEIFPHSTWKKIRAVALYHGFRRKRTAYKSTGHPVLDQVRAKCFEIRWSMVDLDKASRTKKYFRSSSWIGNKVDYGAIGRAIHALAGQIDIKWLDAE